MIIIADRYRLPTCWADVCWGDYDKLKDGALGYLQALPKKIVSDYAEIIKEALSFLDDDIPAVVTEKPDIYEITFDTYISILLASSPIELLACYDLQGKEYSEAEKNEAMKKIEKEPMCNRIGLVLYLREKVNSIEKELSQHYEKYKIPLSQAQKNARITELSNKWGYYTIIDMLAGGDFLKKKEVLQRKMIDIIVEIKYLNEKNYYQYKIQKEIEYEYRRNHKRHA